MFYLLYTPIDVFNIKCMTKSTFHLEKFIIRLVGFKTKDFILNDLENSIRDRLRAALLPTCVREWPDHGIKFVQNRLDAILVL